MTSCFTLDHLGRLTISGPDAVAFAQAQFTNDVVLIDPGRWHPGALCDPKGRTLMVMLTAVRENNVELVMPASQLVAMAERLKLFAIGRQVEFGISKEVGGCRDPEDDTSTLSFDRGRGLVLDGGSCQADDEQRVRWQIDDFEARFPWLSPQSAARHLPQSLGLEALGGLSYSKGCFPGQEVIARVHYRGTVGYRVACVEFDEAFAPPPGSVLRLEDGKRAGEMLWSLKHDQLPRGLAVLSKEVEARTRVVAESGDNGLCGRVSL